MEGHSCEIGVSFSFVSHLFVICTKDVYSKNVNLNQHLDSGSLDFVDVLSHVQPPEPSDSQAKPTLRPLFDHVASRVGSDSTSSLVILDDITSLHWIGFSFLDIARCTRALRALCRKVHLYCWAGSLF